MKILSIGNFGTGWDGSICDEKHIAKALEGLGHQVDRTQRGEVITSSTGGQYDFVLIAQWDGYGDISWLKQYGPVVYWAFDYQDREQDWHLQLIEKCDLYLSKRLSDCQDFPNKWRWLAQDFAPDFLTPVDGVEKDIDVLFTGTYLDFATERNETLKAIDDNFNLTIHSVTPDEWKAAGFKVVNGPVMDQALPALIARAKINISIDHTIEAGYWSDRTAQIMACGGFVLMRYVPLAEARFPAGVEFFYNTGHALTLIDEYLDKVSGRAAPGWQGHSYAEDFLTAQKRVEDLLIIVKEKL